MFYAQLSINGGALCLPVLNNSKQGGFKTLKAAQDRLEKMVHTNWSHVAFSFNKSLGDVRVQGRVLDERGKLIWTIAL